MSSCTEVFRCDTKTAINAVFSYSQIFPINFRNFLNFHSQSFNYNTEKQQMPQITHNVIIRLWS